MRSASQPHCLPIFTGTDLSSPAAATQLLAGADVTVVSVQLVEQKTPAQARGALGGSGGAEGGRDGWRGGTIAVLVLALLATAGVAVYCLCFRKSSSKSSAQKLTISTGASVPPPAQVGLPSGWNAAADPSTGQTYYISPKGEATWILPGSEDLLNEVSWITPQ